MLRNLYRSIRSLYTLVNGVLKAGNQAAAGNNPNQPNKNPPNQQQSNLQPPQTVGQLHAMLNLQRIFQSTAAPLTSLEMLVTEADHVVRQAYASAGMGDNAGARARIERELWAGISRLAISPSPSPSAN